MKIDERHAQIIVVLQGKEFVSVDELSDKFNVSKVTIRTDLDVLEKKGLILRVHGGAMLSEKKSISRLVSNTLYEMTEAKKAIAALASTFVDKNQTVIVDTGSTTVHVAKHLSGKNVTMVTGSLLAIQEVVEDESIEVIILGGILRRYSMGAIGNIACSELAQMHTDILFMGASGYTDSQLYCSNLIEAETKRAMIKSSEKVFLLADSSKEGKKAFASLCSWDDIDYFVTDAISDALRNTLQDKGIKIILTK